ncbi:unnamed protein product, partial [Onchocerca flexuosa]|uniref:Gustatory receptor n=1 Tax=Onchocerca flexuosa TaxID=387005 RepID=A0A183HQ69_9BILA
LICSAKVICVLVAIYSNQSRLIWSISSTLINLAAIILYAILNQIMRRLKQVTTNNFELLQSLKIIVAFNGLGQLTSAMIYFFDIILRISRSVETLYDMLWGDIFHAIAHFIIKEKCQYSTEYRNEFRRQFRKLPYLQNAIKLIATHSMQHRPRIIGKNPKICNILAQLKLIIQN